jgi:hypothetical protein
VSDNRFLLPSFKVRDKFFELFAQQFRVLDPSDNEIFFVKMKAFRIREDIRVCSDPDFKQEALILRARTVFDFGVTFDVIDPATQRRVGSLRRKGLKSMIRDEWAILNYDDRELGIIEEDSWALALVRRFLFQFLPQHYHLKVGAQQVGRFSRPLRLPFTRGILSTDWTPAAAPSIDPRLMVAAAILLMAIEGKQD